MKELNLIGGPFQHAHSSTWWKHAKEITWLKNVYKSDISVYVDNAIVRGIADHFQGEKYAWLLESRVFHGMTDWVKSNIEQIKKTYKYVFTHDESLISLAPKTFKFVPGNGYWIETPEIHEKTKLLSMISSNKNITVGHRKRHMTIQKYASKMDLFGHGFTEIKDKEQGLNNYMFSIAIENDCYDTYFTEKILDCFATGTIPIYWGTKKVCNYFNSDGIIFLDDINIGSLTKDIYYEKMDAIKDNFERVKELEIPEDYFYKIYIEKA
jgi:hypothetical protein